MPLGLSGWQHVLSRQGGRLAFVKENLDGNIWRVDLASTGVPRPTTLIASTYDDSNPDFSPDGRYIVFDSARSGNTELWIANGDGSQPRQLTSFVGAGLGSPRWSPDGARIAFDGEASGSGDIYLIDVNGGKPRRFTDHPARDAVPTWSRDGQWLYFYSTRTGSHQIWKQRVDGGDAVQVTRNGGRLGFESPDGKFLYFVKQEATGLWRIPAQGGDEALVVKDVSYRFSIHGNLAYYHQSERPPDTPSFHLDSGSIRVFDFKTGAGRVLYRPEKPVRFGMSVSPDGRWLTYGQYDSTGSDIMLVEGFR